MQWDFTKDRPHQTKLVWISAYLDQGKVVDLVYVDFGYI